MAVSGRDVCSFQDVASQETNVATVSLSLSSWVTATKTGEGENGPVTSDLATEATHVPTHVICAAGSMDYT